MNQQIEILLVEDNPNDAEMAIRALKKCNLANHLLRLEDGQQALDFLFGDGDYAGRAVNQQPWVVLLDLKLPKVDGLEVLGQLRAHELTRKLPIVMLTSSQETRDVSESYRLGANSYIVKPVDSEKFSETVCNLGHYWLQLNQPPTWSQ
jgi:two-component system, response regulator